MSISLKTEHLKRYKDVAWLLMKYGRSDLVKQAGLEEAVESDAASNLGEAPAEAEELADDLEKLGPTFIKLAQLLSTRADLLPRPYLESLARLQDKVGPFSFGEVERIVTDELGVRLSKAFAHFEAEPLAAASLGQVHRATMRDGREVVVKVQRPNIRERMVEDLSALEELAGFLDRHTQAGQRYDFGIIVGELRKNILRELDYRQEARNLATFAANLKDFKRIVVPRPVEDYTTSVVLTMDFIEGKKITELTPFAVLEMQGAELAEELFHAYLKQMLLDGFFHADPHPGNVLLTSDGRVAIVDLGMVARLTPQFQDDLLQLLVAISDNRGDEAAHITIRTGEPKENFDQVKFVRQVGDLVGRHQSGAVGQMNAGRIVLEITRISGEYGFRLPPEFTMIAKALLNLDQVVQGLDPEFDPNASIRRHATRIMQQRIMQSLSPGTIFTSVLELKEFVDKLPGRVNRLLDAVANNQVEIRVDAIDEAKLMEGFQKVANRITLGLVLAALIVGASLIMRVETDFKLFGYPALAMIFFLVAACAGLFLVFTILFSDEKRDDGAKGK